MLMQLTVISSSKDVLIVHNSRVGKQFGFFCTEVDLLHWNCNLFGLNDRIIRFHYGSNRSTGGKSIGSVGRYLVAMGDGMMTTV